jgi:hypothetical protein
MRAQCRRWRRRRGVAMPAAWHAGPARRSSLCGRVRLHRLQHTAGTLGHGSAHRHWARALGRRQRRLRARPGRAPPCRRALRLNASMPTSSPRKRHEVEVGLEDLVLAPAAVRARCAATVWPSFCSTLRPRRVPWAQSSSSKPASCMVMRRRTARAGVPQVGPGGGWHGAPVHAAVFVKALVFAQAPWPCAARAIHPLQRHPRAAAHVEIGAQALDALHAVARRAAVLSDGLVAAAHFVEGGQGGGGQGSSGQGHQQDERCAFHVRQTPTGARMAADMIPLSAGTHSADASTPVCTSTVCVVRSMMMRWPSWPTIIIQLPSTKPCQKKYL